MHHAAVWRSARSCNVAGSGLIAFSSRLGVRIQMESMDYSNRLVAIDAARDSRSLRTTRLTSLLFQLHQNHLERLVTRILREVTPCGLPGSASSLGRILLRFTVWRGHTSHTVGEEDCH